MVSVAILFNGAQQIAFSFFFGQAESLGVDQWKANRKSWCRRLSVAGRMVEEIACIAPEEWLGCIPALTSCSSWTPRAKSECICGKVLTFWSSSSWVFFIILAATLYRIGIVIQRSERRSVLEKKCCNTNVGIRAVSWASNLSVQFIRRSRLRISWMVWSWRSVAMRWLISSSNWRLKLNVETILCQAKIACCLLAYQLHFATPESGPPSGEPEGQCACQ